MCYSAMVEADLKKLERHGVNDVEGFIEYYRWELVRDTQCVRAMDANFEHPAEPWQVQIKGYIEARRAARETKWQQDLFKQAGRLSDAERVLASAKPTKNAAEDKRIATVKIETLKTWLANVRRTEPVPTDSQLFPGIYTPVIVMKGGRPVITPMRYQCRPARAPALYDRKFPGTYNARRDNLQKFWRGMWGKRHAILVIDSFFENVKLHTMEHRELREGEKEQNVVLHFNPNTGQKMYLACLWDHWEGDGPALDSFAAITDDPPPEVAAAGHDRCVIPIAEKNIEAWLTPEGRSDVELFRILDERERPYYEHQLMAA